MLVVNEGQATQIEDRSREITAEFLNKLKRLGVVEQQVEYDEEFLESLLEQEPWDWLCSSRKVFKVEKFFFDFDQF